MIDMIQQGAVKDAAPKLVGAGLAGGVALALCASKGYQWLKQAVRGRRLAMDEGGAAEQQLRLLVEESDPENVEVDDCCDPEVAASDTSTPTPPTSPQGEDDADGS